MGVDYCAFALIGCEIEREKTMQVVRQRGCAHDVPPDASFCPECGAANWRTRVLRDEEVDGIEWSAGLGLFFRSKGGEIVYLRYSTDRKRAFVGLRCSDEVGGRDGKEAIRMAWPGALFESATRRVLEPLGLWRKETFGLWIVQRVSY